MSDASVDCVVVGAGAVGLAIARAVARSGREVLVLEAAAGIGTETSSRNSEVIHAGLYYPEGSLKARLCVEGKHKLYTYCDEHGVPARPIGKLIVATSEPERALLDSVLRKAAANGVEDLVVMSREEAQALEPALDCVAAVLSPSTGIVDSHALMLAYQGDAEDAGAMVAYRAPIERGEQSGEGWVLQVGGPDPMEIACKLLINAAGLGAVAVAHRLAGLPKQSIPTAWLCKGSYYSLAARAPFSRLIYPVPDHASLGVHLALDLGGQARFGTDVEWIDHIDYDVDLGRAAGF